MGFKSTKFSVILDEVSDNSKKKLLKYKEFLDKIDDKSLKSPEDVDKITKEMISSIGPIKDFNESLLVREILEKKIDLDAYSKAISKGGGNHGSNP